MMRAAWNGQDGAVRGDGVKDGIGDKVKAEDVEDNRSMGEGWRDRRWYGEVEAQDGRGRGGRWRR